MVHDGSLGGVAVPCVSVEAQRVFRTGYDLRTVDRLDLAQLDRLADHAHTDRTS